MQIYILMNANTYLPEYLFNIMRNRYFALNASLQLYPTKIRSVIISLKIYLHTLHVTVYAQQSFFNFFLMQL